MIRALLLLLALALSPAARVDVLGGANHITPTLVAETAAPAPGTRVTLAFAMVPQPTWHGYWANPGDAGMETRVTWTAPKGLRFGALRYPVPGTLLIAGLMNYVYEGPHALLVDVDVPRGLAKGTTLPIKAKLDWLACNPATCVPEAANLALTLTVGDGAADPATRARFDRWRAALPRPLAATARFQAANGALRIAVPLPAAAAAPKAYFFPLTQHIVDYAAPQTVTRAGDRLVIATRPARDGQPTKALDGVLRLADGTGIQVRALPGAVAAVAASPATGEGDRTGRGGTSLLLALGGAVLGGLLLNIMPCVFPILSLKALSLARAGHGGERTARTEALAYTAGVVAVCAALGAALLGLRAAGSLAGWAFQLQDPRVIAALFLLVLAIGLNLAGLFELPVLSAGSGLAGMGGAGGAFWTGALAAFVATPCAGPFLGTALGAAVLLPGAAAMAVFVGLGLGLALPFLLLGFVPALRARLPRPGPWMDTLRRILAVPMLVTALGLAWVLGRQAATDGMATGLAAGLVLALGLWWAGRRQQAMRGQAWLPGTVAALAALGLCLVVPQAPPAAATTVAASGEEPFSETRLAALRGQGRPVFLYFTADWCLTCKVNEAAAIGRPQVAQAFAAKHVATMIGDWTRGDPAISRFLNAHGRSGVPFYLYFPAGGGAPRELPQVLTPGLLAGLA